jgi:Tfp pilus assembly protein PilX
VRRPEARDREGFAAPLAVVMLIAVSLLVLLMLEGALGEVRTGAAAASAARVTAAAETAMAEALGRPLDSTVFQLAPGSIVWQQHLAGPDSVVSRIQVLGGSVARIVVTARSRANRFRVFAGIWAFAKLRPSNTVPGELELTPLGASWWAATP